MKRPYQKANAETLQDLQTMFHDVLHAAGHQHQSLRKLESTFSPAGQHMLDFLDISQGEVETAMRVCEKLMANLAPSLAEVRKELDRRSVTKL